MNLAAHILRKDLRHSWLLILLVVAFVAINSLKATLWVPVSYSGGDFSFFPVAKFVAVWVLALVVVQADLTVGDRAFWRTRPISPGSLLFAKLLLFFVVLVFPLLVADAYFSALLDTSWRVALGMALEGTGFILFNALCAALIASMTASLLQSALALLGAVLVVAIAGSLKNEITPDLHLALPWDLTVQYPGPRIFSASFYCCLALVALLAHQYQTRRTIRTALLLATAVPLVLFAANRWPLNLFASTPLAAAPVVSLPNADEVRIELKGEPSVWGFTFLGNQQAKQFFPDRVIYGNVPALTVKIEASLADAPAGCFVDLDSVSSRLRMDDGTEIAFPAQSKGYWPFWTKANQEATVCRYLHLGVPLPANMAAPRGPIRLFTLPVATAKDLNGKKGTLNVTLKLQERTFHEETRLPARNGARRSYQGNMWRINSINVGPDGATVYMVYIRATSMLVPEEAYRPDTARDFTQRGYVLFNRKLGEYVLGSRSGAFGWVSSGTLFYNRNSFSFNERLREGGAIVKGAIDKAWLKDAELIILKSDLIGSVTKRITLKNIEVPQPAENPGPAMPEFWN
jgi:hypothetical protein